MQYNSSYIDDQYLTGSRYNLCIEKNAIERGGEREIKSEKYRHGKIYNALVYHY